MKSIYLNEKLKLHNKILMQESMLNRDYYPIRFSRIRDFWNPISLLFFSAKMFTTDKKKDMVWM